MANYIQQTLEQGESIIHKGRLHWSYNVINTTVGGFVAIIGLLAACFCKKITAPEDNQLWLTIGGVLFFVGVVTVTWGYFIRSKSEFAITTSRFIQKDGILNIHLTEIPLFKIETVNFYQTFCQRIFNTGSIELVGSGGTCHRVDFIQHPLKVRKVLNASINEQRTSEDKQQ